MNDWPYYSQYLKEVRLRRTTLDALTAEVVCVLPRPKTLIHQELKYFEDSSWHFWEDNGPTSFVAPPKYFQITPPLPPVHGARLTGLYLEQGQLVIKIKDIVWIDVATITGMSLGQLKCYQIAPNSYRVLMRATATNHGVDPDKNYQMLFKIWNYATSTWEQKGASSFVAYGETLVYTCTFVANQQHLDPTDDWMKFGLELRDSQGILFGNPIEERSLPIFKKVPLAPPFRQGTRNMGGASISIQSSLAQFEYLFDEIEAFYVPVGGTWFAGPGDMWLQIMYWDDNFGGRNLLFEQLNPPLAQYGALRGADGFLNFADYTIMAMLIGLTTVQDTEVISPDYDPVTGNGTVHQREMEDS